MKADFNRGLKVSLLFYSEEDGKRALVDKWAIEIGKKYIIGRKKKKVDISIQDITISRIHSEFIFYDKDKIMVKDFGSSNGTFINSQRIEPNKEFYFSVRETLSIGDVKNELIFSIEKNEEEINRNDFDNINERKNINEQFKPIKINKNKKNYFEKENIKQEENINEEEKENIKQEENIIKEEKIIKDEKIKKDENNKNIKNKLERSKSFHKDSSSHRNLYEKDKYSEKELEDKINYKDKHRVDKYNNYKDNYEKYENNKYKKNKKNYRSRSRSNSISFRKPYDKPSTRFRKFKKIHSNNSSNSSKKSKKSEKCSKKNKHKNILSYIIKREEEIEKENDKRQIRLYNQYLKIKEEVDAKSEINNLPNLLPVLSAKSKYDQDSSYSEDSIKSKEVIRLPNFMKRKSSTGNKRYYNKFDRNEYMNKKSKRYSLRYRHSNKLKKYYN